MMAVVQRVSSARVVVGGAVIGEIGRGLCVLASIVREDTDADLKWMINKLLTLRVFPSAAADKAFDVDVTQIAATGDGGLLLVSNFTVSAQMKGRRPGFDRAMPPLDARPMFARFVTLARETTTLPIATGAFGADMSIRIDNDGPVTVILDSKSP